MSTKPEINWAKASEQDCRGFLAQFQPKPWKHERGLPFHALCETKCARCKEVFADRQWYDVLPECPVPPPLTMSIGDLADWARDKCEWPALIRAFANLNGDEASVREEHCWVREYARAKSIDRVRAACAALDRER